MSLPPIGIDSSELRPGVLLDTERARSRRLQNGRGRRAGGALPLKFRFFQASPQDEMSEASASPAPATLPDDDDLLREIFVRLPPLPSSLPGASLVCKRWRRLLADPGFIRRFRAHHTTPPLLGFFTSSFSFVSMLSPPDRVPRALFSLPQGSGKGWHFLGCRHGLAAFLDMSRMEAVVWEHVTGSQRRIAFPPGMNINAPHNVFHGAVLSAAGDNGNDSYCHLSPFKFVLVFTNDDDKLARACLYESESGKWGIAD